MKRWRQTLDFTLTTPHRPLASLKPTLCFWKLLRALGATFWQLPGRRNHTGAGRDDQLKVARVNFVPGVYFRDCFYSEVPEDSFCERGGGRKQGMESERGEGGKEGKKS